MSNQINWNGSTAKQVRREKFYDAALVTLRVSVAAFMLFGHGADKLVNFGEKSLQFADPLGFGPTASLVLAILAEFFCQLAIAFGFLTRLATIPPIITMLVAAFVVHGTDPWQKQEFALLYFLIYLAILIAGPGRFSIDRLVFQKNGDS